MTSRVALLSILLVLASGTVTSAGPDEAFGGVLTGRVVDATGAPIAKATVEIRKVPLPVYREHEPSGVSVKRAFAPPVVAPVHTTVRTGADGRWRVDGLDPALRFLVRAIGGNDMASLPVLRRPGHPWSPVALRLRKHLPVLVRVVDHAGTPLAGVIVTGAMPRPNPWYAAPVVITQTTTDEAGRATFVDLPPGPAVIDVDVAGVGSIVAYVLRVPTSREHTLQLGDAKGATLSGTVRDPQGNAIAGARVAVTSALSPVGETRQAQALVTTSDEYGDWRVEHVQRGAIEGIAISAQGFVGRSGIDERRPVTAKQQLVLDAVLARAGSVHGRVLGPAGHAVERAVVRIEGRETSTDAQGVWRINGLPGGVLEVQVDAAPLFLPRSPAQVSWNPEGGVFVHVRPKEATRVHDLRLVPGVRVEGVVVDPAGEPVADAWIQLSSPTAGRDAMEPGMTRVVLRSGTDGTFVAPQVPPGDEWTLSARTATHVSAPHRPATLRGAGRVVTARLSLHPFARLSGQVQDESGKPAPDVGIQIEGPRKARTTTDARGRFAFEHLPAGSYAITPTYGKRRNREKPELLRRVAWGEHAADVVFRFAPPREIHGMVVDEKGQPVPGVQIQLKADEPFQFSDRWLTEETRWGWDTWTDDRGAFVIEDLGPGGYLIRPTLEDGRDLVQAGDRGVRLIWYRDRLPAIDGSEVDRLNRWSFQGHRLLLEGTVVDPEGQAVVGGSARVKAKSGNGYRSHTVGIAFGVFRTTVPSDAESIDVEMLSAEDAYGSPLAVKPAKQEDLSPKVGTVKFQLEKADLSLSSISGRVLDPEGNPVPGVMLRATQHSKKKGSFPPYVRATSARDGTFRFEGLVPDRYVLSATPLGEWAPTRVTTKADAKDVEVRLKRAEWITGRVLDEAGHPIWGADVKAGKARTQTSIDGTFRVGPVSGASIEVTVNAEGDDERGYLTYGETSRSGIEAGSSVEIVLRRVARIRGVVVDTAGQRVPDAKVYLERVPPIGERKPRETEQSWSSDSFAFEDIPLGTWRLHATDEKAVRTSKPVVVSAPADGVRLVLQALPMLRGVVQGAAGFGVQLLVGHPPETVTLRLDDEGAFTFETKDKRPFTIFVSQFGNAHYALADSVLATGAVRRMELRKGERIEGKLTGAAGFDRAHASVWARSSSGLAVPGEIGADGRFEIEGLPPGLTWTVAARVFANGRMLAGETPDVASGARDVGVVVQ